MDEFFQRSDDFTVQLWFVFLPQVHDCGVSKINTRFGALCGPWSRCLLRLQGLKRTILRLQHEMKFTSRRRHFHEAPGEEEWCAQNLSQNYWRSCETVCFKDCGWRRCTLRVTCANMFRCFVLVLGSWRLLCASYTASSPVASSAACSTATSHAFPRGMALSPHVFPV